MWNLDIHSHSKRTLPLRSSTTKITSDIFAVVQTIINPLVRAALKVNETVNDSFSENETLFSVRNQSYNSSTTAAENQFQSLT